MKKNLLIVIPIIVLFVSCSNYGTHLIYNEGDLYYTKNVSEDDAEILGNYLIDAGFFDGSEKTIQLDKRNDTFLFRMVVKEEKQNNKESESLLYLFATVLSWKVFNGKAVEAHICDDQLKTVKIIEAIAYTSDVKTE